MNLIFWKNWKLNTKIFYMIFLCLFFISIGTYIYSHFWEFGGIIPWKAQESLQPTKTNLGNIQTGAFNIPVEAEIYTIKTTFDAEYIQINALFFYAFLGITLVTMCIFLAGISTMSFVPYAVGMTIFIFWLSLLKLDYLGISLFPQMAFYVCLLAYIPLSYFWQSYYTKTSWGIRAVIFGAITIGLGVWIATQAQVKYPFMYVMANAFWLPVLLTLFFILVTAQEIPRGIFYMLVKYNPEGAGSNMSHFGIFGGIYLINLLLVYWDMTNYFRMGILLLDIELFLPLAVVLGIWGFKQRDVLYEQWFSFDTWGAFAYVSLGILGMSTWIWARAMGNDALVDALREFALYSYMAFGLVFGLYVLWNFFPLMQDGQAVEKIMYEGHVFPFHLARYFVFMLIALLIINYKQKMYYQLQSAYKATLGDNYYKNGEYKLAKIHYEMSFADDYLNHHANYALASISHLEKNFEEEIKYLKNSLVRRPSAQAYSRLGNILIEDERPLDAFFLWKSGVLRLPNSPQLHNNLAWQYVENKVVDSAFFHFEKAKKSDFSNNSQNNLWAVIVDKAQKNKKLDQDIQTLTQNAENNPASAVHYFGLRQKTGFSIDKNNKNEIPNWAKNPDSYSFAYTYNKAISGIEAQDSSFLKTSRLFENNDKMPFPYRKGLHFAEACYFYYSGEVDKGIQLLLSMSSIKNDPYYNTILGLWFVEQQSYGNSIFYFDKAIELGNVQAMFYKAIAQTEQGNFKKASETWGEILAHSQQTKEIKTHAQNILKVIGDSVKIETDFDRYNFVHYNRQILPIDVLKLAFEEIKNEDLRTKAGCELVQYYLEKRENNAFLENAQKIWEKINPENAKNIDIKAEANFTYCQLLIAQKKYTEALADLDKLYFNNFQKNKINYLKGLIFQNTNDQAKAEKYFKNAHLSSPYSADVLLNSAYFFQEFKRDSLQAYNILVNGVRGNSFSIPLFKAYSLQALRVGFYQFGDTALEDLRANLKNEDFVIFEKFYKSQKDSIRKARGFEN